MLGTCRSSRLRSHQRLCAANSFQPALTNGGGFLDQRLRAADGAPITGFGTEHLLMPLRIGESEFAQDWRFGGSHLAVLVRTRQAGSPVDQVEIVFGVDRKERDGCACIDCIQSLFGSANVRRDAVNAEDGAGVGRGFQIVGNTRK